jgi:hypothetical protein
MAGRGSPIKRFMKGDKHVFCLACDYSAHGTDLRPQAF